MKKTIILFTVLLMIFSYSDNAQAQSWRWGIRGGASEDSHTEGYVDNVIDMATDQNNNVYVLSGVGEGGVDVDGIIKHTDYGSTEVVISSFKCDGTYRWSKAIGTSQGATGVAIKTDTLGGVYVSGQIILFDLPVNGYIDDDSVMDTKSDKTMFLLKYDTAGTYKWWVMPEPDTTSFYSVGEGISTDMAVDGDGNIDVLTYLQPGAFAHGAFIVETTGAYILKYNSSGAYVGNTPLNIGGDKEGFGHIKMAKDQRNGRYYMAGTLQGGTLSMGGTTLTHSMFVGAFSNSGSLLWLKQNTFLESSTGFGSRAVIDAEGSIYLVGGTGTGDTFNSYPITMSDNGSLLIVKLDTNGNNVWAQSDVNDAAAAPALDGVALSNGQVAVLGGYNGSMSWPGSTFSLTSSTSYDVFITTFDKTTGTITSIKGISSDAGQAEFPASITGDKKGNFYIGGQFTSSMYIGTDTINSIGGDYDFFVAKYGYDNCNCVTTPVASFTATYSDPVNFTYTGTAADSVVWNFGDGSRDTGISVSHLYAVGTYYACVTAYTACGSNTYCDTVLAPERVSNVAMASTVAVYPNPAANQITIEQAQNCEAIIYNIVGAEQYRSHISSNKEQLNVAQLQTGTYILQITAADGSKKSVRVVKE